MFLRLRDGQFPLKVVGTVLLWADLTGAHITPSSWQLVASGVCWKSVGTLTDALHGAPVFLSEHLTLSLQTLLLKPHTHHSLVWITWAAHARQTIAFTRWRSLMPNGTRAPAHDLLNAAYDLPKAVLCSPKLNVAQFRLRSSHEDGFGS